MERRGAAAVIIGNEVLTAKIQDLNGPLLARRLRDRGIALRSISVVPDEIDAIVGAVTHARAIASHVFTSGGIGPTHDDVTVRAVALALGRPVVRLRSLEEMVRAHYGQALTPEALRLAEAPEGTELLWREGIWYPILNCEGVYLLPGVPQLFKRQLEAVLARMEGIPVRLRSLYLSLEEPAIAHVLDRIALEHPRVTIGSYPEFDRSVGYRVKVTVENAQSALVDEVVARLERELPQGSILRMD
ncbi:MAG TPA: molybdopterin-binding protein [Myxococcaceae bacterium]|nr:molybdopterin-binding protein [Myxococcaceae bacterium]